VVAGQLLNALFQNGPLPADFLEARGDHHGAGNPLSGGILHHGGHHLRFDDDDNQINRIRYVAKAFVGLDAENGFQRRVHRVEHALVFSLNEVADHRLAHTLRPVGGAHDGDGRRVENGVNGVGHYKSFLERIGSNGES
jgi:hypothetical protein